MSKVKLIGLLLSAMLIIGFVPAMAYADGIDISSCNISHSKTLVFDGTKQIPKDLIVTLNGETLTKDTDYEVVGEGVLRGDGEITVNGIGKYTGTRKYPYSVGKRKLEITDIKAVDREYDGGNKVEVTCTLNGIIEGYELEEGEFTISGLMGNNLAGNNKEVDVTFNIHSDRYYIGETYLPNATRVNISKFKVPDQQVVVYAKPDSEGVVDIEYYICGDIITTNIYNDTSGIFNKLPALNGYRLKYEISDNPSIDGADAEVVLEVGDDIFETYLVKVVFRIRSTQNLKADDIVCSYEDTPVIRASGNVSPIQYIIDEGNDVITIDEHGVITTLKTGTAKVTLKAAANENYPESSKQIEVKVNKRTVSVTAKNRSITVGDNAPDLSEPVEDTDYTIEGKAVTDLFFVELKYVRDGAACIPDTSRAGSYYIVPYVTLAADNTNPNLNPVVNNENYEIKVVNGKLDILSKSMYRAKESNISVETVPVKDICSIVRNLKVITTTERTNKKNVAVTCTADTSKIESMGYIVGYEFYRSEAKELDSDYELRFSKAADTYYNTIGSRGTRYYYRSVVCVYDTEGNKICATDLSQSTYGCRVWIK